MQIQIDHKFRLVADKTGWRLEQLRPLSKGPRAGQVEWADEGHFDTLQWALVGAYRLMLHEGKGQASILQLAKRVETVEQRIANSVQAIQPQIKDLVPVVEARPSEVRELNPWDVTRAG